MGYVEQGGGYKPRPFQEEFDAGSQGGKTPGGESSDREGLRRTIAAIGQKLTERIDGIAHDKLTEEEFALGRYYRYSLAVSMRGTSREEFLPVNPVHREDEMAYLEFGARAAALVYLQDFPENPVALAIGLKGMDEPDEAHHLLFRQGLGRNIMQFIRKYNP